MDKRKWIKEKEKDKRKRTRGKAWREKDGEKGSKSFGEHWIWLVVLVDLIYFQLCLGMMASNWLILGWVVTTRKDGKGNSGSLP